MSGEMVGHAKLDNWLAYVLPVTYDGKTVGVSLHLMGSVTDHSNQRLRDGEWVRTSPVQRWEGRTVTTRNTTYVWGDFKGERAPLTGGDSDDA